MGRGRFQRQARAFTFNLHAHNPATTSHERTCFEMGNRLSGFAGTGTISDMDNLDQISIERKTGAEPLHNNGQKFPTTVLSFWQWSASDLINNAMRGRLAEYLVAFALGVADGVRVEWDAYDVTTSSGLKIEVKSAVYLQSWKQTRPSAITFSIRPTLGWNAETNTYGVERKRQADVYVFALLSHRDKTTLDPLNVAQ